MTERNNLDQSGDIAPIINKATLGSLEFSPDWEEFDKEFPKQYIFIGNDYEKAVDEGIIKIKSFITRKQQELVESILAEIPDEYVDVQKLVLKGMDLTKLKQLIRDKYGK